MTRAAARRARHCFAVAASTPHAGERAAAIDRGMTLLAKHGLDPDDFEIPGRARVSPKRATAEPSEEFVERMRAAKDAFGADVREHKRRMAEDHARAEFRKLAGYGVERFLDGEWRNLFRAHGVDECEIDRLALEATAALVRMREQAGG